MARSPFPTGEGFGRNVSDNLPGINIGAPAAGAAGALADSARRVGRQVRQMAERAWTREGEADAANVIAAGELTGNKPGIRQGRGVDDEAYNTVIRERLLTERKALYLEQSDQIDIANPDSVGRWAEADAAMTGAFTPTGDPTVDTDFANFVTVQRAQRLGRVRGGEERARQEMVRGTYVETAAVGRTALGQAIATAGFDEQGSRLVGVSLAQYAQQLARFGPREAFTIGGIEFAADPSRAGVISPALLAETFDASRRDAQMGWISQAAERSPDAASRRAFIGQVQERWQAGDEAFTGLDVGDFDQLQRGLNAGLARAEADEASAMAAAAARARDLLTAGEYGDAVDMAELRQLAEQSGDVGLMAQVDFAAQHGFEATPASLRESIQGGAVGAGFTGWSNLLLDQLEGPGFVPDDNGAGRSQWGITESSHPQAWRDGKIDRAEAAAIYRREYWDAIGADNLDPDLALAAASAAVVGGVGTAQELLRQSGGDVERFLQLEEARFRRLAASEPRHARHLEGWLRRIGRVRGAIQAQRAQRRSADGYASDPIGFARGNERRAPLASMAEMDPVSVFNGGDTTAWGTALQQRRATGQGLAQRDGVPVRMLANEEVSFYKDAIQRDPSAIVPLATAAVAAIGPDGAADLFNELGRGGLAPADLRLAQLASERRTQDLARLALDGRRARLDGGALPAFDADDGTIRAYVQRNAAAWGNGANTQAVIAIAEDMAIGSASKGTILTPEWYVNAALGAVPSNGAWYGGVTEVNGAPTVAPSWMKADRLEDALEIMAEMAVAGDWGPVYQNGQPIPARELRGYRLRLRDDGSYLLINPRTGQSVPNRSGRPFAWNPDYQGTPELLSRRLGQGATLPRAR